MKIPINWLKDYININKSAHEIAESFTALGLLLDKPIEKLDTGEVLDLEHRMDRADWLSIIGCARDLAAMENAKLLHPETDNKTWQQASEKERIKINVKEDGFVNRFYTRVFKNVQVKESPEWLKNKLEAYGIPSRNNLVDITNYVMVELGQPMHAHDLDKMETKEITFRKAKNEEKITTLLGETIELDESVWITTNNDKPTGIGGIVGGKRIEIDENTKNIVLDSGSYDQTTIRRTSRKLKIYNETVLRYDKFLHPKNNELAIKRATKLILDLCGPNVEVYENEDYYPQPWELKKMDVRLSRIEKISGMKFEIDKVKQILSALEYSVLSVSESKLTVEVPFFRTDIEVEDDLVADVLRIYNYENIPLKPIENSPPKEITPNLYKVEQKIREILVKQEMHEHITDPLVEKDIKEQRVILENALTSEKSALRMSIKETLEPVMEIYKKHGIKNNIFEIGLTYHLVGDNENDFTNYKEKRKLETVFNIEKNTYETNNNVKEVLATLLRELNIQKYSLKKDNKVASIIIEETIVGKLKINGFTIYVEKIAPFCGDIAQNRILNNIPNTTRENLSFIYDIGDNFGEVFDFINQYEGIKDIKVIEEMIDEQVLGKGKKAILLQITYKENTDSKRIREQLISELDKKYSAHIRA